MRCVGVGVLGVLLAGCAIGPFPGPSTTMLAKADRLAAEGEYRAAVVAYDGFLAQYADDAKAPRRTASTAVWIVPWAVMISTGRRG